MNNEKFSKLYKFLYFVAVGMIAGFGYQIAVDYAAYDATVNSAPFYATMLVRAGEYLLPSAAAFLAAMFLKKKK